MKKILLILPVCMMFIVFLGAPVYGQKKCKKKMKLETKLDSVSYALGVNIAQNLKQQGVVELN